MSTNPALDDLQPLVGAWRMELYNAAFLPAADARAHSSVSVDWIEGGAALVIRQGDRERAPAAVWIVGRDDSESAYRVLYADERGVSRIYHMSLTNGTWKMWRDHPEFAQRFEATIEQGGQTIRGRWEKSFDSGATWEHDFNIDYLR